MFKLLVFNENVYVEWNCGHEGSLFRCLGTQFKMKVLSGETASKVFIVTTMQTGFLGSQTSRYFNLVIAEDFNYRYVNQLPMHV